MGWRRLLRAALLAASGCLLALAAAQAEVQQLTYARATLMPEGRAARSADVTLPYHWDREQRYRAGEAVFDVPFSLPSEPSEPWGIYFQRIGSSAEISLNGTLLTRMGDVRQPNSDDYAKGPQYVPVPPRLLGRDNVLRVHLRADGGRRGGLSALAVGPEDEVRELYADNFRWRVSASMVVTIFSLLVGAVALALWVTQTEPGTVHVGRRDSVYLAAGLAEICWALRVGDVAIEQPPLPWPLWGVVVTAAFAGWFCGIALFCHHVAGWHRHRSMPLVRAGLWALFGTSIVASTLSLTLHKPLILTAWLGSANVLFMLYAVVYLVGAVRKPEPARLLVAAAGTLNVAMGVRDWIAIRVSGSLADSTWIRYSSVLFGLVLGYIVITRFRAASGQAHDLMANLAARVSEKEAALQQSYARVEQLAREQERTSERARILRDMHDGVGSHISSAIRQLQSGKASHAQVLQTLRDSLDQLKLQIDSMNLPPGDITALLANLRYRLEPRFAASDIELQWDVDLIEPLQRLDAHAMRQLQFMVFEALSNVLQHAQASVLRIEAGVMAGTVQLRVIDNGRGFDTAVPLRRGLLSLRERAAAIGAELNLASQPGRTVVEILID
ncbi:MAG: histidine kinase [Proteobacteria bacterium]|jgi:signal transduction histidine kinase|nr:histidine kinase [Ramlibacter sp.]MCA0211586.1 histidine kinase [Pseudomonadota bacterium]